MMILTQENLKNTKDGYLGCLLQIAENQPLHLEGKLQTIVQEIRRKAANKVVKLNLPTTKDESWRFTDLSELYKQDLVYAQPQDLENQTLQEFILKEASNSRLVFVNGYYQANLSDTSGLNSEQIYVGNLTNLDDDKQEKIAQYLAKNEPENEVFTALNSTSLNDAFVVWVKANQEIKTPIHLLHLSVKEKTGSWHQPRILVVAEANSVLEFIEYYGATSFGCSDSARQQYYFTNAVTEIHLLDNAQVNHNRIQRESGDGFHIAQTMVNQAKNSRYTINEISLGGKLYRHNLQVNQEGEQTETYLHGLTMLQGKQLGDTHSEVNLNHPYGTVNQLHKYILDDGGHGVFNGRVYVPKLAQLTNAAQLNRNLLLSPKARINTKPELQITADNVKCAHGATVSQLEADEIFYLRSRGLNEYDARHLLIDAFAAEIIDNIPFASLRQRLTQCVTCRTIND